jgi:hypothetical protein
MSLGALTIVEKTQGQGPVFICRCSIVGDNAYPAGGSVGLLAKMRAALLAAGLNILSVHDQSPPSNANRVEYDHANDKLFVRSRTTGAEAGAGDLSAQTFGFVVMAS